MIMSLLSDYVIPYGVQTIFISILLYITALRRELSSNSSYHFITTKNNERKNDSTDDSKKIHDVTHQNSSGDPTCTKLGSPSHDSRSVTVDEQQQEEHFVSASASSETSDSSQRQRIRQEASSINNLRVPQFLFLELPPDLQINCLSYLHSRDIVSLSCCSKDSRFLIDGQSDRNLCVCQCQTTQKERNASKAQSISDMLWLNLFHRDYAWVLSSWDTGKQALFRSMACITRNDSCNCKQDVSFQIPSVLWKFLSHLQEEISTSASQSVSSTSSSLSSALSTFKIFPKENQLDDTHPTAITMKEFYFIFSQTWLNYTIAGHSTFESCLTGIHGHVFNITQFLETHPGSPESIILQGGGRDSTTFFESVGHSTSARKIAVRSLVEVIDLGCCSGRGDIGLLYDEKKSERERRDSMDSKDTCKNYPNSSSAWPHTGLKANIANLDTNLSLLPKNRSRPKRTMGTVYSIQKLLKQGQDRAKIEVRKFIKCKKHEGDIMGDVNLYFDPFHQRWDGWYLDSMFNPVFVHDIQMKTPINSK